LEHNVDVHDLLIFKQNMNQVSQKNLVNLCRILNAEIDAKVNIGILLPSKFKVNKDLTRGDAIAPLLFNIVLAIALEDLK